MAVTLLLSVAVIVAGGGAAVIWRMFPGVRRRMDELLFKVAYFLYTNTRIGFWYHRRKIYSAKLKHPDGHSAIVIFTYGSLQIIPIPCVADNYCYVIIDTKTNDAVLVDVSDGEQVHRVIKANEIVPKAVLSTHKHWDHCSGNMHILRAYPELEIYGSKIDKPFCATRLLKHKDEIIVGSLKFTCLLTPGHTKGHMVYLLNGSTYGAPDCLFAGDLLFLAGAGKMFEDSPKVMLESLDIVTSLNDETLIWPGHEYANECIVFATSIDSENNNLQDTMNWVYEQRRDGLPTCPCILREQKLINPFLRTDNVHLLQILGVITTTGEDDENKEESVKVDRETRVRALARLRQLKDDYQKKLQSKL